MKGIYRGYHSSNPFYCIHVYTYLIFPIFFFLFFFGGGSLKISVAERGGYSNYVMVGRGGYSKFWSFQSNSSDPPQAVNNDGSLRPHVSKQG